MSPAVLFLAFILLGHSPASGNGLNSASQRTARQLSLALLNFLSKLSQPCCAHRFAGFGKHLRLFLLSMMFDEIFQHFCLRGEFLRIRIGALGLGHHQIHNVMLFQGLEVQMRIGFRSDGLLECRIENLFFDRGVYLYFVFDLRQKLFTLTGASIRRFCNSLTFLWSSLRRAIASFPELPAVRARLPARFREVTAMCIYSLVVCV